MTDREPRRVSRRWIDEWEKCEWPEEDGCPEREPREWPWAPVALVACLLAIALLAAYGIRMDDAMFVTPPEDRCELLAICE